MSVLKVKNGNQWDIVPAIKGDTGDPAADESITDDMLVTDGIKTEIEWLWGNQLTDSREGEILHAEDAYTAPAVDISVDGKSTQVTTTGKNLLDESNNIVRGYFYDSTKKIEGGGTSIYAPVTEGATYTLSGGNGNRYVVAYTDVLPAVNAPLIAHASAQKTFTVPTGARYVVFYIDSGSTLTPSGYQLEAGSSATAYEPYTGGKASPNPDYPQDIVSVDEPELTLVGTNRIHLDESAAGITVSDGVYDGKVVDLNNALRCVYPIPVGSAITFAFRSLQSAAGNLNVVGIRAVDGGTSYLVSPPYAQTEWETYTYITNSAYSQIHFWSNASSNQRCQIKDLCIRADGSTTYEPYLGNTASLLPDGYSLRSLPDGTKDELHLSYLRPSTREGWAWYDRELVQRISHKTFDGSENWNSEGSSYDGTLGTNRFSNVSGAPNTGTSSLSSLMSPSLRVASGAIWSNPNNNIWKCVRNNNQIHVVFDNETVGINTESDTESSQTTNIKAWLAENPITVYYPLATSITTTLDPIELPIMPSKDTTIWSDPATNLKMTYIQDTNLVIESLEATVADMATS